MCDRDHFEDHRKELEGLGLMTRRQSGMLLGGLAVAMLLPQTSGAAGAASVIESEVAIKTPDGTCDAYFVHPASGTAPGILFWPDIFGLRPALRQMGKRLAEQGYSVLVVNSYYRSKKAPVAPTGPAGTPFKDVMPLFQTLSAQTDRIDTQAFVAWLDQQPSVAKNRKIGTQGYCMGGTSALRATAAAPERIGAAASFHGYKLVTADPDSAHTLAATTKASLLIAISANDDKGAPEEKNVLKETFAKANVPAEIEVYAGPHGWCLPDFPIYNAQEAERAWSRLLALYSKALA